MYNVLERLRVGVTPDALEENERRVFNDGLVLLMKDHHDQLDVAVADAYGWPANLSDSEILTRLVALNKQRSGEEARGVVLWLRPEYQIPLFGTPKERAELDLAGVAPGQEAEIAAAAKSSFPADDVAQTAAVMALLASATAPQDAITIASGFKQGRRTLPKVQAVLAALTRMGFVTPVEGGKAFTLHGTL
jgi:hypothetical protein